MGNLGKAFQAEEVSDSLFGTIPAGRYSVEIVVAELRDTRAGDGRYVFLDLQITAGDYANRHVFDRLNIDNPSQRAVEIATKRLQRIGYCIKQPIVDDTAQLLGKQLIADVRKLPAGKDKDGIFRDESNEVRWYHPLATELPF